MRPRGPYRSALAGFVSGGGAFTMSQIATALGCSISRADDVLRRALDAGEVRKADKKSVPGVKRPVQLYEGADARTNAAGTLTEALQAWAR